MRKILVFGHKGKIIFAGTYEQVLKKDTEIRAAGRGFPLLTHMSEVPYDFVPTLLSAPGEDNDFAFLKGAVGDIYSVNGKFGDFGDVITVLENGCDYIVASIAPKAFHKPGLATDLVPILVDFTGRRFFVGTIRGQEPGKGKPALIGGFNNIAGFDLDSSVTTLFQESRGEVGMKLSYHRESNFDKLDVTTPFPSCFGVEVEILGNKKQERAYLLGVYNTSEEEKNLSLGQRRVHCTAGYVLPIHLEGGNLNKEILLRELVPQDLVENNKAAVYEIGVDNFTFGIGHHNTVFKAAVDKLNSLLI